MFSSLKSFCIGLIFIASISCADLTNDYRLSHDYGAAARPRTQPLADCKSEANTGPAIISEYLQNIAYKIMDANTDLFKGYLAKGNFCFKLGTEDGGYGNMPNAFANPRNGMVFFNKLMLEIAPNDAAVAAVMGHELAHVTMDHRNRDRLPPEIKTSKEIDNLNASTNNIFTAKQEIFEKIRGLAREHLSSIIKLSKAPLTPAGRSESQMHLEMINDALDKLDDTSYHILLQAFCHIKTENFMQEEDRQQAMVIHSKCRPLFDALDKYYDEEAQIYQKIDKLYDQQLGGEPGVSANWREQEADEVGFELYRKAGLPDSEYFWFHEYMLKNNKALSKQCEEQKARSKITRGGMEHPTHCWRLYNLNTTEMNKHKQDYSKFPQGSAEILPGGLRQVKEFLK